MPSVKTARALERSASASTYTLGARAETLLAGIYTRGSATLILDGDGDGVFRIRVYVDGVLKGEQPTSTPGIGIFTFSKSLEVKLYNPGTATATAKSPTFEIKGVETGV